MKAISTASAISFQVNNSDLQNRKYTCRTIKSSYFAKPN